MMGFGKFGIFGKYGVIFWAHSLELTVRAGKWAFPQEK